MPRKIKQRAAYGSGSVVQVRPGVWRVRVRAEGAQICRTVVGSEAQAVRMKKALISQLTDGSYVAPASTTFGEFLTEWLENVAKAKAPNTYKAYKLARDLHLEPALGSMQMQKVRPSDLRAYFNELNEKGLAESTQAQHFSLISAVYRAAINDGLVSDNPALRMAGRPRAYRISESQAEAIKHCWTEQEARRFLAVAQGCGPRQAAFYTLALDTGMRRGELCALTWADVDLLKGSVRISKSMASDLRIGPTKSRRARAVTVSPETLDCLRRLSAVVPGGADAPLFVNVNDRRSAVGPAMLAGKEFKAIVTLSNVKPIKFHGLRHTCATLLLAAGVPVNYVSERLVHQDPAITLRIYAHAIPSGQAMLMDKLRNALGFTGEAKAPAEGWRN